MKSIIISTFKQDGGLGSLEGKGGVRRELVQNRNASCIASLLDFRAKRVRNCISMQTMKGSLKKKKKTWRKSSNKIATGLLQKITFYSLISIWTLSLWCIHWMMLQKSNLYLTKVRSRANRYQNSNSSISLLIMRNSKMNSIVLVPCTERVQIE